MSVCNPMRAVAIVAMALAAGDVHATSIIFSTTQSFASHSATVYDPTNGGVFVQVSVPYPNNGPDEGDAGAFFAAAPSTYGTHMGFSQEASLLAALNDPTSTRLVFVVDQSVREIVKPTFSARVTNVDWVPLSFVVTHPQSGGTDVTSQAQFNFFNDPNVPEPSALVLFVIGGGAGCFRIRGWRRLPQSAGLTGLDSSA